MDWRDPSVASNPPAACSIGYHLAGSRGSQQAAAAPMEPACGYGNIGNHLWFGAFRSATCLCERHLAFWRSHDHLGDNHGVVVTELASRQNRHSWRVKA